MGDNLPNDFEGIVPGTSWTLVNGVATPDQIQGFNAAVTAAQQAAVAAQQAAAASAAAVAQAQAILDSIVTGPGGGDPGTFPDATTTTAGKIVLAGDLGGTAALPTVPVLAGGDSTKYFRGDKTWQTLATDAATPAQIATLTSNLNALSAQVAAIPDVSTVQTQINALSVRVSALESTYNSLTLAGFPNNICFFVKQNADGSWPQRPITDNLVLWFGFSLPPTGGTTTSAGGFVEGVDISNLLPVI